MAWYRSGTISVTNGSTAVTGSGTAWIANVSAGESLYAPDGKQYEIASINSDTTLTLATAYLGSNQTGQSYFVIPTQSYLRDLAGQAAALVNSYSSYNTTSLVGKFNDGTLTSPGISFSSDQDTGFRRTGSGTFAITNNGTDTVSFAPTGATFTGDLSVSGKITAAINGAIGATTPNTGAFTTLTTMGNVTLGDAATDTVTVNGKLGVGGAGLSNVGLRIVPSANYLTGSASGYGVLSDASGDVSVVSLHGVYARCSSQAAAYSLTGTGVRVGDMVKGAGSTISSQYGVYIDDQTQGTNNYGITSLVSSGTNKWNIYASGTARNYLAGDVLVGTTTNTNTSKVVSSGTISETVGGTQYLVASQADIGTAPNEIPLNGMLGSMAYQDATSVSVGSLVSSGNVGIGTSSPTTTIQAGDTAKASDTLAYLVTANGAYKSGLVYQVSAVASGFVGYNNSGSTYSSVPTGTFGLSVSGSNPIVFSTNNAERMRLDASGNLGLGVTPSAWTSSLKAMQIGAKAAVFGGSSGGAVISNNYYNDGFARYLTTAAAAALSLEADGSFKFFTTPSGTAGAAITFTQVLAVEKDKSLALQGATSQAGAGISFPATQVASSDANTLDDYEEGTWTPTQGAGLTVVGAFSSSGTYTKVGRKVTLVGSVTGATSISVAGGQILTAGLPFTPAGVDSVGAAANSIATQGSVIAVVSGNIYAVSTVTAAATTIRFSVTYTV